jgi:hypothetical protein
MPDIYALRYNTPRPCILYPSNGQQHVDGACYNDTDKVPRLTHCVALRRVHSLSINGTGTVPRARAGLSLSHSESPSIPRTPKLSASEGVVHGAWPMCVQSVGVKVWKHFSIFLTLWRRQASKVAAEGRQGRVSNIEPFRVNPRQVPGE